MFKKEMRPVASLGPLAWERENLPPLGGEWNGLGRSLARACFERCFPLTPALSLGARENLPPLGGESDALRRAGVSALNRGAHGACVVDFIGSSPAHWCFERGN